MSTDKVKVRAKATPADWGRPPHAALHRKAESADVALLLEGTFPYVAGGVSSWVNQIINGFPHLSFAIVFLGSRKEDYSEPKFKLPDNVVHFEAHYLYNSEGNPPVTPLKGDREMFENNERLHNYFQAPQQQAEVGAQALEIAVNELQGRMDRKQFLYSEESWNYTTRMYKERCTDPSFVDYFWTVRTMHAPIWTLSAIVERLIPVKCFHSVSTGYAGFLGALLKRRFGKPLILSEHGIYTKERRIDLYAARWIADNRSLLQRDPTEAGYFRQAWIRFFEALGRMCYDASDQIIALYEANRLRQVQDGAQEARTFNIPNGIDVVRFGALRAERPAVTPKVCCLIGRVVPIKDIKTYIRAMRVVANRLPEAEAWIAGPEDESPAYAQECHDLTRSLGLEANVKFLGFQKLTELLPKVGLVVLSSISEALPLVLLEGYAAGVPGVSTDVGSCRQLIYGLTDDDKTLGASGEVVGIADPQALAESIMAFFTDDARWQAASDAGVARVNQYYTHPLMFARYGEVYRRALAGERADLPGFTGWAAV